MKTFVKETLIILSMSAVLNTVLEAHSDEFLKLTPGRLVAVKIPETSKSTSVGFVADPDIADIYRGLKDTFVFVGKKVGTTEFIAVDNETGVETYRARLIVDVIEDGHPVTVYNGKDKKDKPEKYTCNKSTCMLLSAEEAPSAVPPK
jgi:Flp pilus assembly secretin CpaC